MNNMNFNGMVSRVFFSFLIFTSLLIGCSKDREGDLSAVGNLVKLSITIDGIKSPNISPSLRASLGNQVGLELPKKKNIVSVYEDDVFFDIISEEVDLPEDIDFYKSTKKNKKKYASTQQMANGIKYRLLFYNKTTGAFYTSVEGTVGQVLNITVTSGEQYDWYAYSYNNSSSISAPLEDAPSIVTPTSTPLLYASGVISPMANTTTLPILFEHQLTQLRVEIKEGIRPVLSAEGTFDQPDYIKTSSFNLKDGTKGDTFTSAGITTLNFSNYILGDTIIRLAEYYTADDLITSYSINLNSIGVDYKFGDPPRILTSELPNSGNITFSFPTSPLSKKGYILKGVLELAFVIPEMKIQTFSNNNVVDGYRLGATTNAYKFLKDTRNFGTAPGSIVKSRGFIITDPTSANEAASNNTGREKFNNLLNNPANYPDILVFANYHDYASYGGHQLMNAYLKAGGAIFYTHDDASLEDADKAGPGLALILEDKDLAALAALVPSERISLQKKGEDYSVYRFTDTPEGAADNVILNGPFGDVRGYNWGQDRAGTSYVTGITSPDVIIYSNQPVNHSSNNFTNQAAFLRHKTKNFFFAGDGGFFLGREEFNSSNTREPFRTDPTTNIPVLSNFGTSYNGFRDGYWTIANSLVFGNAIAYMMNRVHYYGINKSTGVGPVNPDPTQPDDPIVPQD